VDNFFRAKKIPAPANRNGVFLFGFVRFLLVLLGHCLIHTLVSFRVMGTRQADFQGAALEIPPVGVTSGYPPTAETTAVVPGQLSQHLT
jgi:hypothetical protein